MTVALSPGIQADYVQRQGRGKVEEEWMADDKDNGFNYKQELFLAEYLTGEDAGNATRSWKKVYETESDESAAASASEFLRSPKANAVVERHRMRVRETSDSWVELAVEAKARLVELSRSAKSESIRFQATKEILDRGFGRPEQKLTVREEKEGTVRAVQSFYRRAAMEGVAEGTGGEETEEVVH